MGRRVVFQDAASATSEMSEVRRLHRSTLPIFPSFHWSSSKLILSLFELITELAAEADQSDPSTSEAQLHQEVATVKSEHDEESVVSVMDEQTPGEIFSLLKGSLVDN